MEYLIKKNFEETDSFRNGSDYVTIKWCKLIVIVWRLDND